MNKPTKIILWIFVPPAVLFILAVVVRVFVTSLYVIPQEGMLPTYPPRTYIFGLKRPFFDRSAVQVGDVVVFEKTMNDGTYNFIWRVIALGGDKVETRGAGVKVNGVALAQTPTDDRDGRNVVRETNGRSSYRILIAPARSGAPPDVSVVVPAGHFFAMGDNRFNAYDSRFTGTAPITVIKSKIVW
ncbi:MAG: signal peptidase I [Pseudomonadota bacterium]